ncbi:MFS general substrate transporter [Thelephora terrestris]|uniref:MFS general substrate transporter n=1 Tax=Thelephora terrestris TaxID=56493 RepID=A0A9P6L134_9AGAM|nr:MFS general substrate transporter [Thelephora terrestris]
MIPLLNFAHAQHRNHSELESQASSHLSLSGKQKHPALDIPIWRRWLVVLGAFLALFCTFGQLTSFGTYLSWYKQNQLSSYSSSTISWIGSLQLWMFFFSGAAVGWYFDHHGPRPLLVTGAVIYTSSIIMISFCKSYYQYLLAQGVLFGLGVGLMFYPPISSVATHFSEYRATALGIAAAGSSAGGIVFPIMLRRLFLHVGFPYAVRISGFLSLLCCGISALTITSARPPSSTRFKLEDYTSSLKNIKYLLLLSGSALISLGLYVPFFYIPQFVQARGYGAGSPEDHVSTYILAIMNFGGLLGRIVPAALSDHVGRFNMIFLCALFSGVSCMALWLPTSFVSTPGGRIALEITFALSFGFFSGGFIALINVCIAEISETEKVGSRIGLLYCLVSFPSMAGGPLAGRLLGSHSHAYVGMILFTGATTITGSLFILWTRLRVDSRLFVRV